MAERSGTRRPPTSPSSRPQETMGRSNEDIEPKSVEWKEEQTAHILNVHLPGFIKEQIRVTYDDNLNSFNVRGERPLGNNRWGRLNVDITVPDNCKMSDVQGKFQDEMLTITIPKKSISPFFVPKETTQRAQLPTEKAPSIDQKPPAINERPKVPPQMAPSETAFSSSTKQPERQSDYEKLGSPKGGPTRKSVDPRAAESPRVTVSGKGKEILDVPSTLLEKEMKRTNDTDAAGFDGKEMRRPKIPDLVQSKAGQSKSGVDDAEKKKRDGIVGEAEKQLIVNVGVAALALMALGAYIGYNFACLRSAQD